MLKWTVGHRKASGGKRSPVRTGSSGGPCYSIRRAAARLQQAARRGDKENREGDELSPRTRDSVYMRLDSLPAALRDVSNQLTPGSSGGERSRKARTPRSARPEVEEAPTLPVAAAQHLSSTTKSPLHIEYSPCPLRATKSLLALRRRLVDAFVHPHHSVGTLHPAPQQSHDNPLYFTLQRSRMDSMLRGDVSQPVPGTSSASPDEIPTKVRRRTPPRSSRQPYDFSKHFSSNSSRSEEVNPLSPLARHLQNLRLSCSMSRVTPPSPFVNNNTTFTASHNQTKIGYTHDVTDPRFLSMFSMAAETKKETAVNMDVVHSPTEVNTLHLETYDSKVLRKNSLRRTRTITSTSEEGPPAKVQPVEMADGGVTVSVAPTYMNKTQSSTGVNTRNPRQYLQMKRRKSFRRGSRSASGLSEDSALRGLGDGVFTSENMVCDSIFSNNNSQVMVASGGEELEDNETFTLKRQGGIRRRNRLNEIDSSEVHFLKFPRSIHQSRRFGLTLPEGIPSPNSTELPQTSQKAADADSSRFGLTLSKGIPSPDSPTGEIPGIRPLATSPAADQDVFAKPAAADWRRQTTDENGAGFSSSSSDDTWNSHRMHFMKTPRLTKGHILSEEPPCATVESLAEINPAASSDSPLALVEQRSRSRRCLLFASPGGSTRHKRVPSRRFAPWRRPRESAYLSNQTGELDLAIYGNSGLLTIHVVCGRNLRRTGGTTSNAYVKVTLVPASEERTFHRTTVHRESSAPWFDQKFSFEVLEPDLGKRVLVSAWHRDKERRRSEFLGCMSFAVKHAVKKEISGSFRLLSQSAGRTQHAPAAADSSVEEVISIDESDAAPTPVPAMERRKSCTKKKADRPVSSNDDSSFLRHLELEPAAEAGPGKGAVPSIGTKGGRTPFTTTRRLTRHGGGGFGFSVAWTQPPRVERVEAGQSADRAGLRPGDYVIFVDKYNVVTMPEDEILHLIRSCDNILTLEVYRRSTPNGLVSGSNLAAPAAAGATPSPAPPRSSTTCSATTTSLDLSKRRLHLPQVTFSSEVGTGVIV